MNEYGSSAIARKKKYGGLRRNSGRKTVCIRPRKRTNLPKLYTSEFG